MSSFLGNPIRPILAGLVIALGAAVLAPEAHSQGILREGINSQLPKKEIQPRESALRAEVPSTPLFTDLELKATVTPQVGLLQPLTVTMTVSNVGDRPVNGYQYAVGSANRSAVWKSKAGVRLAPDQSHHESLTMDYHEVYYHFGELLKDGQGRVPQSVRRVCFGVFLLAEASNTLFTDMRNPNHQQQHCIDFMFVTEM